MPSDDDDDDGVDNYEARESSLRTVVPAKERLRGFAFLEFYLFKSNLGF